MKKMLLIVSIGLCVNTYATAQSTANRPATFSEYNPAGGRTPLTSVKEIDLPEIFREVEIRGDITVILTNEPSSKLLAKGSPKDLSQIKITLKDRQLLIDTKQTSGFSKLTIYIPVLDTDLLVTNGETEIFSMGTIKSKDLKIILNGASRVSVYHEGKLKVLPGEGYALVNK